MIDALRGRILSLRPDLLLELGPVTLRLEISERTRAALADVGAETTVYAELRWREEQAELLGFATPEERRLFRLLTGISGVGKRLALAVLSELSVPELAQVIAGRDEKRLTRISGVGSKTASRLILELQSKLDEFLPAELPARATDAQGDPDREEALLALIALGMNRASAETALARVGKGRLSVEEMIRRALSAQHHA